LPGSEQDHLGQATEGGAADREQDEQCGVYRKISTQAEDGRKPTGKRDNDNLGHQVSSRDPTLVRRGCPDSAADVSQ
jgi:hypothetical protein